MSVINLDFNLIADGITTVNNVPVSSDYMFYAIGDFDGGTLSLEASPDDGVSWLTVDQLTAEGRLIRYLVSGEKLRISLSGSTSPTITTGIRQ